MTTLTFSYGIALTSLIDGSRRAADDVKVLLCGVDRLVLLLTVTVTYAPSHFYIVSRNLIKKLLY